MKEGGREREGGREGEREGGWEGGKEEGEEGRDGGEKGPGPVTSHCIIPFIQVTAQRPVNSRHLNLLHRLRLSLRNRQQLNQHQSQ